MDSVSITACVPAGEWAASFEILAPGTTLPMHATALSDWAAADRAAITEKVMIAIFFIHFIIILIEEITI
ncbi:MAG: hypothetical protein ACLUKN_02185 [Bacilli bacterium]